MRKTLLVCTLFIGAALRAAEDGRHEVGLTLGSLVENDRGSLTLKKGMALQANYGIRLVGNDAAALFGEVHFLASPQREVGSAIGAVTRDVASLYVTPGLRFKFAPNSRVQPYFAIGGGYALYEQSTTAIGGQPNPAPRHLTRGAFMIGGGVDIPVLRWIGARFEVRDFYTGNPAYNVAVRSSGQHNVVVGGGFVLRF
jgi:opacity protein-like surface antigen